VQAKIQMKTQSSGTGNELIHFDSLPLCFNSFQTLKGNLGQILVEDHSVCHEMLAEQIP
jgi:hypothetical protein